MKMTTLLKTLAILGVTTVILSIISVVLTSKNNSAKPALENTATDISGHRQDKKVIESTPRVIDKIDYSKDTEDGLLLN